MDFPSLPGAQWFVVPGPITLSVVYGTLTKQHTLNIEPDASDPSSARELNIPAASAVPVFVLVLLVPGKSTISPILFADMFSFPSRSSCYLLQTQVGRGR